ncbi:MAG: 5,10-methylenetetrahydromethanopterin reductase [Candidatus Bathyarchaeum sp.]|nr:MAG: 5,10-methylenetetrahydromethanopterin reductase [Candidatus Bathyarchaeum sp.]
MVKFGVEFVPKEAYWKTVYYAIQSEKRGFDNLWITDHYNNRNVYVTLAATAMYTKKIIFGPGVTNPFMVNPIMTTQSLATLDELAPGRVVLGMGAGDKTTLASTGIEAKKQLSAVVDAIAIFKAMLEGKSVNYEGNVFKVSGTKFNFKPRGQIPVYIGAQGPKMLATAGKIGDGVLINASHPKDVDYAVSQIKKGVDEAGKSMSDVDVTAYTSFSVHKKQEKAEKAASPVVAFIVAGSPDVILQRHGLNLEAANKIRGALKKGDFGTAFGSVSPEMIEAFSIAGTPDICNQKITRLLKAGITQFVVGSPIGPNVRKSIDLISEQVIPQFKE